MTPTAGLGGIDRILFTNSLTIRDDYSIPDDASDEINITLSRPANVGVFLFSWMSE